MGLIHKTISQRDSYINKGMPLSGDVAKNARILVRGLYARLGTWRAVGQELGLSADSARCIGLQDDYPIQPKHLPKIRLVFSRLKHLPRKDKECSDNLK